MGLPERYATLLIDDDRWLAVAQVRTPSFFSSDDTPLFERPAVIGDTAWFPSIAGLVYPVDVSDTVASAGEPWHLVPENEQVLRVALED